MRLSRFGKKCLAEWRRDKRPYIIHHRFICLILIINFALWGALITGRLPLGGLQLRGAITSVADHQPCKYENSFVRRGEKINGVYEPNLGTSLEACNIRATGGAIVGNYFISEGVMYIGGPISWGKAEYLVDEEGDSSHPWGMFMLHEAGITIEPDFENKGLRLMGAYVDKNGLRGLADSEIERIAEIIKNETKD